MPVLAVITHPSQALPLVKWATACALARADNVIALHPAAPGVKGESAATAELPLLGELPTDPIDAAIVEAVHHTIRDQLAPEGGDPDHPDAEARAHVGCPIITALRVTGRSPVAAVLDLARQRGVSLLIAAQQDKDAADVAEFSLSHQLFRRCPCEVIIMRPAAELSQVPKQVLVPTAGGPHATAALKLAAGLAEHCGGKASALFVEPNVGPEAAAVGQLILDRHVRKALGAKADAVNPRVVVANDFRAGIERAVESGYDLVLVGASDHFAMRKVLFGAVPEKLVRTMGQAGVSVAVMRRAIPMRARVSDTVRRFVERTVPQLDRDARLSLVERVQGNSRWNFDFVSLIALSTMIAALGLIMSSVAVVIGAMLVAPLMTPLIGCGLALVQGNVMLVRQAIRSVLLGFVLAFAIGLAIGLLIPGIEANAEILGRTRPNLSGALPGVAIAAALVPPIASAGLMLALGEPVLSAGAALLFLTNIVAIVLGAAIVLFAVGVRAGHTHGRDKPWVRRGTVGLIVATAVLAVPLSYLLYHKITAEPRELIAEIRQRIERVAGSRYLDVEPITDRQGRAYRITISAPQAADPALANELSGMISEYYGGPVRVRVVTQLATDSGGAISSD